MAHRIEIYTTVNDTRSEVMLKKILAMGYKISSAKFVEVYTINKDFKEKDLKIIAEMLANPVSQKYLIDKHNQEIEFDYALEIGFLPGVTDNVGNTAKESIEDLLKSKLPQEESVHFSYLLFLKGDLTEEKARQIGESLANSLIERIHIKAHERFAEENGMDVIVPKVKLKEHPEAEEVDLDITEEELIKLGKQGIPNEDGTRRGPLALDKESLQIIKKYFEKEGRKPTDVELESLAQTWSEHCKHTIFAAKIDDNEQGLYKGLIKKATQDVRKKKGDKDFCVSVFSDNSGGIIFDENWIVTDKAETHNSPSALDPFGGAITGIVGVNRDTIGFGQGAKPIINKYGFCVGYPDDTDPIYKDKDLTQKALSPKRILEGIVGGVNAGGNCSGIPTPQGFIYTDIGYKGKPLVFVGTVGLIPRVVNGRPGWDKKALPGDKVVVIGGRVGQDGIHGATFSSEALTSGSPATAVQIGDPITQKKLSDAVVKEARDLDLYTSITDNGAGGLSCSIAEMAKETGGCYVDLDKIPLKYPNLEPWKIWISESQERMTLSVPEQKLKPFLDLMERRGVEATVVGEFNDSGKCIVISHGKKIMDIDMDFLHDGLPQKTLKTTYTPVKYPEPVLPEEKNLTQDIYDLLAEPNLCSYEFISHQFDHEVQAGSVLKPLQGKGKVNAYTSITKPLLDSQKGIVTSQGIPARYSYISPYDMAACSIDTAIRNVVSAGAPLDYIALMDNFCWCSSEDPERLGHLKLSAQACYDYATKYVTPFISGKDSMFNDFKGFDSAENPVKISVPETLMISATAVMDDVTKAVSLDPKFAGDLVYILGETFDEMGASEYFYLKSKQNSNNDIGGNVPKVDADKAVEIYKCLNTAIDKRLIASAIPVNLGGIGIALAKSAISGNLGLEIDLSRIPHEKNLTKNSHILFSESQSRIIVTIDPKKKTEFETLFKDVCASEIGIVTEDKLLAIKDNDKKEIVHTDIQTLNEYYRKTFKDY